MFGFFDMIGDCARKVFGCICLIACIGPILFIIGIVMLAAPNSRKEDINTYNSAVLKYDADDGDGANIMATVATVSTAAMSTTTETITIEGNLDDVSTDGKSSVLLGTFDITPNGSTVSIPFSTKYTTHPKVSFTANVPVSRSYTVTTTCNSRCTTERSNCVNSGGNAGTSYHCGRNDYCMKCTKRKYLSSFCGQIQFTGTGWMHLSKGCDYPFRVGNYESSSRVTSIVTKLRSDEDPYIVLQRVTDGSSDFGLTSGQQRGMGAGLLVAGVVLCIGIYGGIALAIYCVVKAATGRNDNNNNGCQGTLQEVPVLGHPVNQSDYNLQSYPQPQPPGCQGQSYGHSPGYPTPSSGGGYGQRPPPPLPPPPQAFGGPQQGYSPQQAQGYPPQQAQGYPPQQAQGYPPQQAQGYPPQQAEGYPPQQAEGYPPQQSSGQPGGCNPGM